MVEISKRMMKCDIHGEYEANVMNLNGREMITGCPHCEAEKEKQMAAEEAVKREQYQLESDMKMIGIPKRYQHATLESFEAVSDAQKRAKRFCTAFVERFQSCLDKGTSLVFCGNVGTGKTHLAYAIAREVHAKYHQQLFPRKTIENLHEVRPEVTAKVVSALDIMRDVKAVYAKGATESEQDVIDRYTLYPLLIIDEVGVQYGSEHEKIIMFDVLNRRYLDMKPTIMISNLTIADLNSFVGDRVLDRLKENSGSVIDFSWESHRK